MQIAIDGPAGAGKSTVAKRLADKLGFTYIDTGAMYRALTLKGLKEGFEIETDNSDLIKTVLSSNIEFHDNKIFLDGEDVSEEIRRDNVNENVSRLSNIKEVRNRLVELQRDIASTNDVVMDGRDIGSVVLPDADLKVYLDASSMCRAKRRAEQVGIEDSEKIREIQKSIDRRDEYDSTRENSPLVRVEDAFYLLTDEMTIDEVVDLITEKIG